MKIFDKVSEKTVIQEVKQYYRYPEFTWREPIFSAYDFKKVLEVQELLDTPVLEYKTLVKYKVRSRYIGLDTYKGYHKWVIQLWLLCNEYTGSKTNKFIGSSDLSVMSRSLVEKNYISGTNYLIQVHIL